MSKSDEFDLRELLGEPSADDMAMPAFGDVPASELTPITTPKVETERPESAWIKTYNGAPHGEQERLSHPQPEPPVISVEDLASPISLSPDLKDESGELDEEYYLTFNATIVEVKDLEPEQLQALRHRLDRMIRRAKIQQRAIRVTEEGKLSLVEEKRRKAIRVKDSEFMSKRKVADEATGPKTPRTSSKGTSSAMSQVEKQVKQFVKLAMNEATIRATLSSLGTAIPENLAELIAKHTK